MLPRRTRSPPNSRRTICCGFTSAWCSCGDSSPRPRSCTVAALAGLHPLVHRRGGHGGRRVRESAQRGLDHQHAPRPWSRAGQGRAPRRRHGRTAGQDDGLQRRPRRQHAHVLPRRRPFRHDGHGGQRHPLGRGRGAQRQGPRDRPGVRRVLRRWRIRTTPGSWNRSISPPCKSCRCFSCARTTSMQRKRP